MANKKSILFDEYIEKEQFDCFERNEMHDEDDTVVYRTYVQTEFGDIPVFVLLDATIYSIVRFVVGPSLITDNNRQDVMQFINEENSKYKSFKYYIEDSENTLYLDVVYMGQASVFSPSLLYALMKQVVEYIPAVAPRYLEVFGTVVTESEEQ